jgi:hypothetical protein
MVHVDVRTAEHICSLVKIPNVNLSFIKYQDADTIRDESPGDCLPALTVVFAGCAKEFSD